MNGRVSKEVFISVKNHEVMILKDFIKSIEVMKSAAAKWDGKVINKRFITAMDDAVNKVVPPYSEGHGDFKSICLKLDEYWDGTRVNRIEIRHANRWVADVRAYVNDNVYTFYPKKDIGTYIDEDTFRLNYDTFVKTMDAYITECQSAISDKEEAISKVDDAIKTYSEIREFIKDKMNSLPSVLQTYIQVSCPVYDRNNY